MILKLKLKVFFLLLVEHIETPMLLMCLRRSTLSRVRWKNETPAIIMKIKQKEVIKSDCIRFFEDGERREKRNFINLLLLSDGNFVTSVSWGALRWRQKSRQLTVGHFKYSQWSQAQQFLLAIKRKKCCLCSRLFKSSFMDLNLSLVSCCVMMIIFRMLYYSGCLASAHKFGEKESTLRKVSLEKLTWLIVFSFLSFQQMLLPLFRNWASIRPCIEACLDEKLDDIMTTYITHEKSFRYEKCSANCQLSHSILCCDKRDIFFLFASSYCRF